MAYVSEEIEDDWLVDSASVLPDGTLRIFFCDPDNLEHQDIAELILEGLSLDFFRHSLNDNLSTFGDLRYQEVIAVARGFLDQQELEDWAHQDIETRRTRIQLAVL